MDPDILVTEVALVRERYRLVRNMRFFRTRTFHDVVSTYVENACRTANGTAQPAWSFRIFRKPLGPWSSSRRRASHFSAGASARCLSITLAASSAARAARVGLRTVGRGAELDKAIS